MAPYSNHDNFIVMRKVSFESWHLLTRSNWKIGTFNNNYVSIRNETFYRRNKILMVITATIPIWHLL